MRNSIGITSTVLEHRWPEVSASARSAAAAKSVSLRAINSNSLSSLPIRMKFTLMIVRGLLHNQNMRYCRSKLIKVFFQRHLRKKLNFSSATIKFIFSSLRESILDILVLKERSKLIYSCNETMALCFFRIKLLWKFNF